jgi:hypothetical protein
MRKEFNFKVECRKKGDRSRDAWRHLVRARTREEAKAAIAQRQSSDVFLEYEFRILDK